jgi:hypothetical protein
MLAIVFLKRKPNRRNAFFSPASSRESQGCQMVYFHTKNLNLGKFFRVLKWKRLVYFKSFRPILRTLYYMGHLVYLLITYLVYFPRFGKYYRKNLATPASLRHFCQLVPQMNACKVQMFQRSRHSYVLLMTFILL